MGHVRSVFSAALLLPLVACGEDSESPTSGSTLASIRIRPAAASLNALGATQEFSAQGRDGSGSPMPGVTFAWTSSATDIATVDASGVATAVGNGTATIRASADGVVGSTTLTIRQAVAAVTVTGRERLDAIGDTARFRAAPLDARSNPVGGRTVEWTSSDEDVATIDAAGLVTAVADGSTRIEATADGVAGSKTLTVSQTGTFLRVTTQPSGAAAGQPLGTQPVVTVTDALGNPVAGDDTTEVTAAVASGGGTLVGSLVRTASDGVVTFTDLGMDGAAGDHVLSFTAEGLQAAHSDPFPLVAGPPVSLAPDGGDEQTAPAATPLPQPLSVSVSDEFGNGVEGTTVSWSVDSGSGTLASPESLTDGQGVARIDYTLGRFAGDESVTASVDGLSGSPVTFTATATPNATISGVISLSDQLLAAGEWTLAGSAAGASGASRTGAGAPARATKTYGFEARSGRSGAGARGRRSIRGPEHTPDELLVTFRSPALSAPGTGSAAYASRSVASRTATSMRAALHTHARATGARVSGVLPAVLTARVTVDDPAELEAVGARLRADPAVARVERNPVVWLDETARRVRVPGSVDDGGAPGELTDPLAAVEPDDPLLPWQAWHYAMIDAPEAWRESTGIGGVIVAVVDDGIRFDHPGISANLTADGYDFVSNSTSLSFCSGESIGRAGDGDGVDPDPTQPLDVVYDGSMGCISGVKSSGNHGLHVAGTVGAVGNDAAGGTGVAWNVSIRPVRVVDIRGSATHFDLAQGVLYAAGLPADDGSGGMVQATSGAPIINVSLGGPATTATLVNAIIAARDAGSLIVAAAGNDGTSDPHYPAAYPQSLSVSAVGPDWQLASYSSFGSTVDIAAPGGDHADAPPGNPTYGVFSTAWDYGSDTPIWDGSIWNGTSMAAPHVSGVAALLLSQEPGLTASQLESRLLSYAIDVGPSGPDNLYGAGVVNARNSLTRSEAPPQELFARLVDAGTGAVVETIPAEPDGSFAFEELPDGEYHVFAGQDAYGDGEIGVSGRRWGAFGGSNDPTAVTVSGADTHDASFTIGLPVEDEPNDTRATANALALGGYMRGVADAGLAAPDYFAVQVPAPGTYTFETVAVDGACAFALDEDTVLELYDDGGTLIAQNDDIDFGAYDLCSRITETLSPGTYYVAVLGYNGTGYSVTARSGG